ncbi:MAG: HAMP domain-containing sensor histidine kinase [Pirellulaceae bacterium]
MSISHLPVVDSLDFECRLPLSQAVAETLLWICAEDDPRELKETLDKLVRREPLFALWVALRVWHIAQQAPKSLDDLVRHVSRIGMVTLLDSSANRSGKVGGEYDPAMEKPVCTSKPTEDDVRNGEVWFAWSHRRREQRPTSVVTRIDELVVPLPFGWQATLLDEGATAGTDPNQTAGLCLPGGPLLPDWLHDVACESEDVQVTHCIASESADRLADAQTAETLFKVAAKLSAARQLERDFQVELQRQKMLAMKELAYGAGHEINNPLANISTRAQLLLRDETNPERRRVLQKIHAQAFRAYEMIADMMLFAKPPELNRQPIDGNVFWANVLSGLEANISEQGTTVTHHVIGPLPALHADPSQLHVAVRALLVNSLQALAEGGEIHCLLSPTDAVDHRYFPGWQWEVRDNGPGIDESISRHIFDPFYSGREAGRGLGFGLPKAWRIVHEHSGSIDVTRTTDQWTVFRIRLAVEPNYSAECQMNECQMNGEPVVGR